MTDCHCDTDTTYPRHEDDCDSDAAWIERAFPSVDFEYDDAHGMADAHRQEGR